MESKREREKGMERKRTREDRGVNERKEPTCFVCVCTVRFAKHTGPGAAITCDRSRSTMTELRHGTDTGPGKLRQSEKAALDKPQI